MEELLFLLQNTDPTKLTWQVVVFAGMVITYKLIVKFGKPLFDLYIKEQDSKLPNGAKLDSVIDTVYKKLSTNDLHEMKDDIKQIQRDLLSIELQLNTNTTDIKWIKKKNGFKQ